MENAIKEQIDNMGYEQILRLWRFAPVGHPFFTGEIGDYFTKVMREKAGQLKEGEHSQISKKIGWN